MRKLEERTVSESGTIATRGSRNTAVVVKRSSRETNVNSADDGERDSRKRRSVKRSEGTRKGAEDGDPAVTSTGRSTRSSKRSQATSALTIASNVVGGGGICCRGLRHACALWSVFGGGETFVFYKT